MQKKTISYLFLVPLLAVFLFSSGCTGFRCGGYVETTIPKLNLKAVFDEISAELCEGGCGQQCDDQEKECRRGSTVMVTDFVDIQSLRPGRVGMFLGELMKGSMNNICCNRIQQVEFSKYFELTQGGLVALTRDFKEIKATEFPYSDCVVGTYSYSQDRLYIFIRKINVYNGKITKFVTKEISFSCVGDTVIKMVR